MERGSRHDIVHIRPNGLHNVIIRLLPAVCVHVWHVIIRFCAAGSYAAARGYGNDVRLSRGRGERGLSGRGTSAFTRLDVVAKLRLHLQERLVVALVLVAAQPFLRV